MKKYTDDLVTKLGADNQVKVIDGIDTIIKNIPFEKHDQLDPLEEVLFNFDFVPPKAPAGVPLVDVAKAIRKRMGFANLNLNTVQIYTKYEELNVGGRVVGLWRYYPRLIEDETNKKTLIFVHGGGCIGGTAYVVENYCKLIAERANCVVFNVEYSLAPEHHYPCAIEDIMAVIEHVYTNANYYGLDRSEISIGGDSAGAYFSFTAAKKLKNIIKLKNMFLLYIGGSFCKENLPADFTFDISKYNIPKGQERLVKCLGLGIPKSYSESEFEQFYCKKDELLLEDVCPLLVKDFTNLPRAIFICPEYDGLRLYAEYLMPKMKAQGASVLYVKYMGMTHAFIDRLGYVSQAEDSANLISSIIRGEL